MHDRDYRSNDHPPYCTCVKCSKTMNIRRANQIYNRSKQLAAVEVTEPSNLNLKENVVLGPKTAPY